MSNEEKTVVNGKKKALFIAVGLIVALIVALILILSLKKTDTPDSEVDGKPHLEQEEVVTGPIELRLKKPDDVTIEGLKDVYETGEEVCFTVSTSNEYSKIYKVKINGDKTQPDEDGYYRATVKNRLYIIVETKLAYGNAEITIEESNSRISYNGMRLTLTLQDEENAKKTQVSGTVQNGKIILKKVPLGTWDIEPISFMGGEIKFESVTLEEQDSKVTTKRATGVNDKIGGASAKISMATSSVFFTNSSTKGLREEGYCFLQGQNLEGSVWFGMKVKMSAEDLQTPDYPFVSLCIYEDGWNLIQVMGNSDGTASVKYNYDTNTGKKLDGTLVEALTSDGILLAAHRTTSGKVEIYGGVRADDMELWVTYDKPNMKRHSLDQFGFMTQGKIKNASIENITSGNSMAEVLSAHKNFGTSNQNVTVSVNSTSSHLSFENVEFTFTLERDKSVKYTGAVKNGKIALGQIPTGKYQVSSVDFFGGTFSFDDILVRAGSAEVTMQHKERINDTINSDAVKVDVETSSVNISNCENVGGVMLLQDQNLSGDVWFGMKVQMSEEDLNATDYRNIGINIYKNGSNRIQVVSLGNGRVALKYDNSNQKELSGDMAKALVSGKLLVAVHRTANGKLEVYAGVYAEEMTKLFTVDSPNMKTDNLDQFGLDMQGPLKGANIWNLTSGKSMEAVLKGSNQTDGSYQDVTVSVNNKSDNMSFEGVTLTLTLERDTDTKYTGTVTDGKIVLNQIPLGTYKVSSLDFFGGTLSFDDVLIWEGRTEVDLTHKEGISDTVDSAAVKVDVASSSVTIANCDNSKSSNLLLQGQKLTGDVWFGMKVQMSADDLNATDYRNIGINIYKNGSNRIQVVSLGNGRVAIKYDGNNQKELSSDMAKALASSGILVAVHRTEEGKLEVYAGVLLEEMTKLFTVDSPNMKADALDQFGLDMQGPLKAAGIQKITSGESMDEVLDVFEAAKQNVTVKVKSKSGRMSFEGVTFTFTLKRDTDKKYTGTVTDGQIVLNQIPLGTYKVSSLNFFGGKLTFDDVLIWEGRTEVEIEQKQGINDSVGGANAQINVANSSVAFVNSSASTNRSDGYFFLQGQELKGDVWFGMKVKMSAEDLSASGNPFVALCIYENGWNLIQVMSVGDGTAVVKFNYNHQALITNDLLTALTGDGLLLAVNRAEDGTLKVYGGTVADEMQILTKVTATSDPTTNMQTADLDQFGFMTQGNMKNASIENITSGETADDVISGFELGKQDVTVSVKGKSARMSFKDVKLTFTLKSDSSVKYTGTADANGQIVLKNMQLGTYKVSDVAFLGGKLTFPDVVVLKDTTTVEITHNEGLTDAFLADQANTVKINVATSSVTFDNSSVGSFKNKQCFFLLNNQNLSGDVWFGMKVKMTSASLNASGNPFVGLVIWEDGRKAGDYWNMIQVMANKGNAVLCYNNNHKKTLSAELLEALTGDGILLAVSREIDESNTTLKVWVGTTPENMECLITTTNTTSTAPPNMDTRALDQFGIITAEGAITSASIENITSGTSMDEVLSSFSTASATALLSEETTVTTQPFLTKISRYLMKLLFGEE